MQAHQLLVTLDVKAEAFVPYVAAMRAEEAGARSEAGNLGFDLWMDAHQPYTIHLLEFWASEQALVADHARQPYYQHVRGMEAQALTGAFEERLLVDVDGAAAGPTLTGKTLGAQIAYVTVWQQAPAELAAAFEQSAPALRAAPGNRFWRLYANQRRVGEMLLIEAWDDAQARGQVATPPQGAALRALAEQATQTIVLRKS